ncbi:Heat stress transcription factor [Seminavis robusta]|uniref:Heat stress transcription factor n=1 Tax=Seminavis robusta TaxID=568900 RepID=A0A9N8DDQ9_9STRA|nr:Heat stress transcription factor [Seminavis robusta]|eukprot:Sro47_g027890.1 Heat stress transcription factor (443) ;mRNA; r:92646-94065
MMHGGKIKTSKSGKGKGSAETAPLFLRKTYHMIDSCDPSVGGWCEDGLTFLVKDTELFAATIIPQFFKHSNWSSFVRQLNFYGFRKIKTDPLRIRDAVNDLESKFWSFRHENFQRGRPDLLLEIKKSNHVEAACKQEVEALKKEVDDLKATVVTMNQEMEKMAALVATVLQQQQKRHTPPMAPSADHNKRRRMNPEEYGFVTRPLNTVSSGLTALQKAASVERDLFGGNVTFNPISLDSKSSSSRGNLGLNPSIPSFTSTDEQILGSLFALESTDNVRTIREPTRKPQQNFQFPVTRRGSDTDPGAPDDALMKKLRTSIAVLPKNLQEMFVDRIVTFMTNPESFRRQVDAVSALANAAAIEATKHVGSNDLSAEQSNVLGSAVLGAGLAKYGVADQLARTQNATMPSQMPQPHQLAIMQNTTMRSQPQQPQIASVLNRGHSL